MPAIKAKNSKNLIIDSCKFSGWETDIELENVEGFLSINNEFSKKNDPRVLLPKIIKSIKESRLDKGSQKRLYDEIMRFFLIEKGRNEGHKENIRSKLLAVTGKSIADYFVRVAAAVTAGLIMKQ